MVLVRLAYVADLPAPAELVRTVATPSTARAGRRHSAAPLPGGSARAGRRGSHSAGSRSRRGRSPERRLRAASDPAAEHAAARRTRSLGRARSGAAKLCRGRRAVRHAARGADPLASAGRTSTSFSSSRGGSSSARRRARRATSPTGSASCWASGPGCAG